MKRSNEMYDTEHDSRGELSKDTMVEVLRSLNLNDCEEIAQAISAKIAEVKKSKKEKPTINDSRMFIAQELFLISSGFKNCYESSRDAFGADNCVSIGADFEYFAGTSENRPRRAFDIAIGALENPNAIGVIDAENYNLRDNSYGVMKLMIRAKILQDGIGFYGNKNNTASKDEDDVLGPDYHSRAMELDVMQLNKLILDTKYNHTNLPKADPSRILCIHLLSETCRNETLRAVAQYVVTGKETEFEH
jgi:hypothetical protein